MGVSILLLFTGLILAGMIMTIYLSRIIMEGFPELNLIISSFIPLGPCGQGAYCFLLAGENFKKMLPNGHGSVLGDELSGRIINVACLFAAMIFWVLGLWWLVMALIAIADDILHGRWIPFRLAFWGVVFPNVRSSSTRRLTFLTRSFM